MTAGIDISQSKLDICVKNHGGVLANADFSNDMAGAKFTLELLAKHGCLDVAMESTGPYWYGIFDYLTAHGVRAILVNPAKAKAHLLNKTDNHNEPFAVRLVQPSHLFFSRGWHTTIRGSNPIFQEFAPTKRVPYSSFGVETPVALPGMKLLVG